jgi:hypothetical protein
MRALIVGAVLFTSTLARAGLVSEKITLSEQGCRFPDVATAGDRFLVVWADYAQKRVCGRFVATSDAKPVAPAFCISEPVATSALFPAVGYAKERDELLVTWDDEGRGDVIHGQRVRRDGTLLGANFAIGTIAGTIRSAVAWCGGANRWLVAYGAPVTGSDVHARLLDAEGKPIGAALDVGVEPAFAGYPSVVCGGDRFLVTWDHDDGNIRARIVDAATGTMGPVRAITTGGAKDRSQTAFDPVRMRFVVAHNEQGQPGFSYDQYGRLVALTGETIGEPFALAHEMGFEGDTQFGGDIAVLPAAQRMVSSFGTDNGMSLQEADIDGKLIGPQVVLGTGNYTSLSNAADDTRAHVITAWEGLEPPDTQHRVFVRLYQTSSAPVPPINDAGVDASAMDAAIDARKPALDDLPAASPEGCGCRTPARAPFGIEPWLALVACSLLAARRRRPYRVVSSTHARAKP